MLVEFSSSGHVDAMGLFFLVAGLWAAESGRTLRAGALWGLAMLAKLAAIPLLPWMLVGARRRRALATFLGVTAVGYAAFLAWPGSGVRLLFAGTATYAAKWSFNASLYGLLAATLPVSATAVKASLAFLLAAASLLLARRLHDDRVVAYTALVWALLVVVSPVVHPWYVVWLVPLLCFHPVRAGIALTGLVGLSYLVLNGYARSGAWQLAGWVPWVEYGVPLALLAVDLWGRPACAASAPAPGPRLPGAGGVALVIPALDEEESLPLVLREILRSLASWVLVVDNGSRDRTAEVARAGGARVLREERRGYGSAVLAGLAALPTECDVVVVMDADYSDRPEDLERLLAPIRTGEADLVVGSRVLARPAAGALAPHQRFRNWLSCRLIRLLFGFAFTDLGPFRAVRREALDRLGMRDTDFGWNVEMQIKAACAGLRVVEVPVGYRRRIGASKISGTLAGSLKAGAKILGTILRYRIAPPRPAAEVVAPG